jgi:hypothetical protein
MAPILKAHLSVFSAAWTHVAPAHNKSAAHLCRVLISIFLYKITAKKPGREIPGNELFI